MGDCRFADVYVGQAMEELKVIKEGFVGEIKGIIDKAREGAVRSVNFSRVMMYWNIGRRIFEEEQQGKERAAYGSYLIKRLAERLEPEYGSGFGSRQLRFCLKFFRMYPIVNTVCSQLSWSQYKLLIAISNEDKRKYYEMEAVNNVWTKRELERQINSGLYERLLISNDKESVLAVARRERIPESPQEVIKDPMMLEFLGLERKASYYEKDIESAIIEHLAEFLLEMGKGFSFVARQRRILLEDDEFFVDLVLYNRLLRCFVIVELKTGKLTHQDLGQLQMYVNYYDRCEKLKEENPTIGILLCSSKNDTVVKMALPEDNRTIMASRYELYMPSSAQLAEEVGQIRKKLKGKV